MHPSLSLSYFTVSPAVAHGYSINRRASLMQRFNWLDHCIAARSQPDSLLYNEERLRILHHQDASASSPRPSIRKSVLARLSSRCGRFLLAVVGLVIFSILILLLKHLLKNWIDRRDGTGDYQHQFLRGVCNETISKHLFHLTRNPHVAGTAEDFATADYVRSQFQNYGLSAHFADYNVLLSYPLYRSLILNGSNRELQLELSEESIDEDPSTSHPRVIPTFHGFSPSGNVTGSVVYANYGRDEDFTKLHDLGINVSGAFVIAKYGSIYRGDIVDNAARHGAVGVAIFTDPADYAANYTYGVYPRSKWLPDSGVQRGSVYTEIGDPLTPGWPSVSSSERLEVESAILPSIPSLPISAHDASIILKSIRGPRAPDGWGGALDLDMYRIGGGAVSLNLNFVANQSVFPIRNVLAVIEGSEEPDRYVVIGNHRDAWTFGAVDPNSGTSSLLELARGLGNLLQRGWKPKRSIVLGSWDAEEYGLIGSTEWVEHNADLLMAQAVAYINVDCAVGGPGFFALATPQLDSLLRDVTKQISDPDGVDQSVYDSWAASSESRGFIPKVGRVGGGGSDFAAFIQHAGVPAVDMSFGESFPVYHTMYDTYHWMEKFGDHVFRRNVAMTSIWGLITFRLANDEVLPFDYLAYANELQIYATVLETNLEARDCPSTITLSHLYEAIKDFMKAAVYIRNEAQVISISKSHTHENSKAALKRRAINDRLMLAERGFLDADGLPGRPFYKHLVYGPTKFNNYGTAFFPGILDTLSTATNESGWRLVHHEIWRVTRSVRRVAQILGGKLT